MNIGAVRTLESPSFTPACENIEGIMKLIPLESLKKCVKKNEFLLIYYVGFNIASKLLFLTPPLPTSLGAQHGKYSFQQTAILPGET